MLILSDFSVSYTFIMIVIHFYDDKNMNVGVDKG